MGALAGLERAGAAFGVHSNWGESGPGWEPLGHYKQCGFEELVTCNDQPPAGPDATRQPRACYQVYAAYGNTSGVMAPVSRHCDDCDAFASYDDGPDGHGGVVGTAWVTVGRYGPPTTTPNRTVHVRLSSLPPLLVSAGQTAVTLATIPNMLQRAVPHPTPLGTREHTVTRGADTLGFDLDLHLPIINHDVWTVRVLKPSG